MLDIGLSAPRIEATSFAAEAARVHGLAADARHPWMREALERIAQGYEQLAELCAHEADAGTPDTE